MSSEKGNVKKSGGQKHKNRVAYKNNMHDTNKRTKQINDVVASGICTRCKDVVEWKIKYKKYKPLTQPKKCVKCLQKTVKKAYYVVCEPCSKAQKICAKCAQSSEIVLEPELAPNEEARHQSELNFELRQMSERKRRKFFRLQESGKLNEDCNNEEDINDEFSDDEDCSDEDCNDKDETVHKLYNTSEGGILNFENTCLNNIEGPTNTDQMQLPNSVEKLNIQSENLTYTEDSTDTSGPVERGFDNQLLESQGQLISATNIDNRDCESCQSNDAPSIACSCDMDHSHCVNNNGCGTGVPAIADVQQEKLL